MVGINKRPPVWPTQGCVGPSAALQSRERRIKLRAPFDLDGRGWSISVPGRFRYFAHDFECARPSMYRKGGRMRWKRLGARPEVGNRTIPQATLRVAGHLGCPTENPEPHISGHPQFLRKMSVSKFANKHDKCVVFRLGSPRLGPPGPLKRNQATRSRPRPS